MKHLFILLLLVTTSFATTVSYTINNSSGAPLYIQIIYNEGQTAPDHGENTQGGVIATVTVEHGEEITGSYTSDPTRPFVAIDYIAASTTHGIFNGNSYVWTETPPEELVFNIFPDSIDTDPFGANHNESRSNHVVFGTDPGGRPEVPDADKTLWRVEGDELTSKVYREGVDKIVYQTGAIIDAIVGSGGGSGSGSGESEDSAALSTLQLAFYSANPTAGAIEAARDGLLTTVADNINNNHRGAPGLGVEPPSGNPSLFVVTMAGKTFNLDPASIPAVETACAWIKALLTFAVFIIFEWWLWAFYRNLYRDSSQVQNAKGGAIAAGTGEIITSLVVAVGIVTILVTLPVAFFAAVNLGIIDASTVPNPIASMSPVAAHLINLLFPLGTITSAGVTAFAVTKVGHLLYAGIHAAIKFIII